MLAAAVLRARVSTSPRYFRDAVFRAARARESAAHLGLPLRKRTHDKFLPLIYAPPHGFWPGHNPASTVTPLCSGSRGPAGGGVCFLFTGKSWDSGHEPEPGFVNLIARGSGFADLLLRPLSARS